MNLIAWAVLVWGALMIVSSFALPGMIGKERKVYTAGTAASGMAVNIGVGALLIALAAHSLFGGGS